MTRTRRASVPAPLPSWEAPQGPPLAERPPATVVALLALDRFVIASYADGLLTGAAPGFPSPPDTEMAAA
ncbi:hypothetical protein J4H86_26240 [Spiractinospora alimapuensis]|uniref:hypothetical protein n=1 Tax=Spiractinospora alimapuensis TaxID=2820884 RepID=UPI001F3CADBB|nr:hypothetical protein [Spiractinospora alimapuensis]QVQ52158.1 hypothetical protein J4H86_26240 [Spiractinospora alimapuensis]